MTRRTPRRFPIEILEARTLFAADVTFASHVDFAAGTAPIALAAADFNGDGNQDLVVVDNTTEKASVYFGNGTGGFTAGPVLALTSHPVAVVVGDFNGDGRPDVAVGSSPGSTNAGTTVTIFINAGGTFGVGQATTVETGAGTDEPIRIATGDFNGDGHLDVVATEYSQGAVAFLAGTGAGSFAAPVVVPTGSLPNGIAVGDFNEDGKLDFAVTDTIPPTITSLGTPNALSVYDGSGGGQFAATPTVTALNSTGSAALATGNFNSDTAPDLVVGNTDNTATVLINTGGGFTATAIPTTAGGATAVAVGDFNVDGIGDFAVANGGTAFSSSADAVTVVGGIGGGSVQAADMLAVGSLPTGVAVADFNHDGKPDIATANEGAGTVSILLNSTAITAIATTTALTTSAATAGAGSAVTLTATVTGAAVSPLTGESIPTGAVNFYDGRTLLGAATLAGGAAAFTTTALTIGSHNLTARYVGDAGYGAGASTAVAVAITPTADTGPDLVGAVVANSVATTLVPGEVVPIKLLLTNGGNTVAKGNITDTVYLSTDGTLDGADVPVTAKGSIAKTAVRLNAGKSSTLSGTFAVPIDTAPGTYYVLVAINSGNTLAETTTADNTAATAPTPVVYGFGTVGGRKNVVLAGTTVDNIAGSINLNGPGTGVVTVGDNGTQITLTGTTLATNVTINTAMLAQLDGLTDAAPLGSFSAKTINLAEAATLAGVKSLTFASATTGAELSAGWIGSLTSLGDFKAATTVTGAAAPHGIAIGSANIKGAVGGVWSVAGIVGKITAGSGGSDWSADVRGTLSSLTTGTLAGDVAARTFGSVLIRGDLTGGEVVAGTDYGPDGRPGGEDDTAAAGAIGSIRVIGSVTTSLIAAGVDSATAPTAVLPGGSIRSVTLGALDTTSKVLAAALPKKVRVGAVLIDPTTDGRFKV